jgi:hypothetical protein
MSKSILSLSCDFTVEVLKADKLGYDVINPHYLHYGPKMAPGYEVFAKITSHAANSYLVESKPRKYLWYFSAILAEPEPGKFCYLRYGLENRASNNYIANKISEVFMAHAKTLLKETCNCPLQQLMMQGCSCQGR